MTEHHIGTANSSIRPIKEASFVFLDFEMVTPPGRPPEPLELAAITKSFSLPQQ